MKKIVLFVSAVFFTVFLNAQTQIGNAGFEDWTSLGTSSEEPTNWNSFMTATGGLSGFAAQQVQRSTAVRAGATGTYCARIWSRSTLGIVANGNLTLGQINMGSSTPSSSSNYNFTKQSDANFSEAITDKPDSIVFWVKFTQAGSGTQNARMHAVLHDNYTGANSGFRDPIDATSAPFVVAEATLNFPATGGNWVRKSVPFVYNGPATNNTFLLATFTTNQTPGGGAANDEVLVDDVELVYVPKASFTPLNASICPGGQLTFSNTTTNFATSYSWSFPGGTPSTSTDTNPTVTYATAGTYSVTLTASNQWGSQTITEANIIQVGLPDVQINSSATTICPGGSATLTATGANTFSWDNGGSTAEITVTPTNTTTYTVTGTEGNCSNTATITVTVGSAVAITATAADTVLCQGSSVTLNAFGGDTYTWSPGNLTGSSVTVTPTTQTTYTVTGLSGSCEGTNSISIDVVDCASLEDLSELGYTIYPNPFSDVLVIEGISQKTEVRIISATGQIVLERLADTTNNSFNVSNLNSGIYFLHLVEDGRNMVHKIVK